MSSNAPLGRNARLGTSLRPRAIAIGASAGSFECLCRILEVMPRNSPVAVFVVFHLHPRHKSFLPELLQRYSALEVSCPQDGEKILPGHIYIAPPARHLTLAGGKIALKNSPAGLYCPSVDVLFESLSGASGPRTIGVVLSGFGNDGSRGICMLKLAGALTLAQDPGEAKFSSMPRKSIETGCIDFVLPIDALRYKILDLFQGSTS